MTSPIKDVLQALSRHADVVETSISDVISTDAGTPAAAIAALRQASALRSAGEEGYRLHPRLREYLQDHLQLYPAFQSLAEIGSRITQLNVLWTEVERVGQAADQETVATLIATLQTTAFDIVDSMDRNMLLLQTLLSTRFGNVKTLDAKKSQNRYYQQQTATLAADVTRLARVVEVVERESSERSMEDLARFLRRNLLGRITPWQQGLSEMQTQIRREIFRTREFEKNLKLLARMDMLLRQQPAWRGFEVDLDADIPVFLLATAMPSLMAHVEPLDNDRTMRLEMEALVRSLPPKEALTPDREPPKRYTRIVDPPRELKPTPSALALARLVKDVRANKDGISLIEWRAKDQDAGSLDKNVWLVFAVMALRSRDMRVDLVRNGARDGERFTHTFRDATAHPTARQT